MRRLALRRPSRESLRGAWQALIPVLIALPILIVGALIGAAVALNLRMIVILIAAIAGGLLLLSINARLLFAGALLLTYVGVGLATTFGGVGQALWAPYFFGLFFYIKLMTDRLVATGGPRKGTLAPFVGFVLLFALWTVVVAVLNEQDPLQFLIASKNYLFLWSLMLACMWILDGERHFKRVWQFLIAVALLQFPFALFEYVVFGGRMVQEGGKSWDAVVGTFGGLEEAGGQSATMGFFLVFAIVLALAMVKVKALPRWLGYVTVLTCLATLTLAEVKVMVLVYLPIAVFLAFRHDLRRNPAKFMTLVAGAAAMGLLIMSAYVVIHYQRVAPGAKVTAEMTLREVFRRETDPDFYDARRGTMGKIALVVHWWRHNDLDEPIKMMAGNGMGSTHISKFFVGEVVKENQFRVDRHLMSILLWETGVMGLLIFAAVLGSGALTSFRLARDTRIPETSRALLDVGGVGLLLCLASFIDNRFVLGFPTVSTLMMLLLGHAGYWWNHTSSLPQAAAVPRVARRVPAAGAGKVVVGGGRPGTAFRQ